MKKILFLQIKGNALGGVWFVNKTLGEEFLKRNYDVQVLAIRNNHPGIEIKDTPLKITTINKENVWEIIHKRDVLASSFNSFFKTLKQYFVDRKTLKKDYEKMKDFINAYNPDYIISSHYQTLFGVPKKYLNKTIFVQHSSFDYLLKDKANIKTLKRLNDKIHGFSWLCKSTMEQAISFGFIKNKYIYNPNKFITSKCADVIKNKKIVVITRIHKEKRIDLMIQMINDIFKDKKYGDWKFEIYGVGSFNEKSEKILKNSTQILYKGLTNNPMEVLLNSSLTLNTSIYEGFSLSIIEGFSCGLPVISFNFGESAHEQIINGYNGYVIEDDNVEAFKETVKKLLDDENRLEKMGKNAKEFSKRFSVSEIANNWECVFEEVDKNDESKYNSTRI